MHPIVEQLRRHTAGEKLPPPASLADIDEAEKRLGFQLPSLLRELYGIVADGSFGPPYGFLPLLTPVPETTLPNLNLPSRESVVQLYTLFRGGDPEDPSWLAELGTGSEGASPRSNPDEGSSISWP